MPPSKDDVMVLLKLDEVFRPSVEARKFSYSSRLAEVVAGGCSCHIPLGGVAAVLVRHR